MHTLVVQTKFTFGDRVRFDSATQHCNGLGRIAGITIYNAHGEHDYFIDVGPGEYIQGGIEEHEITLEQGGMRGDEGAF